MRRCSNERANGRDCGSGGAPAHRSVLAFPANGDTLGEVLDDLDRRYPGLRFRVVDEQARLRRHVRFFINGRDARDVQAPLRQGGKIYIVGALSGG